MLFHNFLSSLVPVPPRVPSTDSFRLLLSPYLDLPPSAPPPLPSPRTPSSPSLVFQHFSFLPPPLLLPRLAPFLSQAPGVYSVIARPSRTTCVGRRSLEFHLIPPFPRSISFRTTSLLRLPSPCDTPAIRHTLDYFESIKNCYHCAVRMFSSVINVNFNMQLFFP